MAKRNLGWEFLCFALLLLFVTVFLGCAKMRSTSDITIPQPHATPSSLRTVDNNLNAIEESTIERHEDGWSASEIRVGGPVSHVFFINDKIGWASGNGVIYRTSNAGQTWDTVPLWFVRKDDDVMGLYFDNDREGWLIVQFNAFENEFSKDDEVRAYRTTDGGKQWKLTTRQLSSTISDFDSSAGDAWLIGRRFLGNHPQQLAPLVLHFSKTKTSWSDVSANLSDFFTTEKDRTYTHPMVARVLIPSVDCAIIATDEQELIESCDSGLNWHLFGNNGRTPFRMGINQIGMQDGHVWMLAARGGVEGTESRFMIVDPDDSHASSPISVAGYYLMRGSVTAEHEFIAAGIEEQLVKNLATNNSTIVKRTVILRTNNGGIKWLEVFASAEDGKDFFFSSGKTLWFVDRKGKLYKIVADA